MALAANSLRITLKESGQTWRYGDVDRLNLRGTARTLDNVDGVMSLEEGCCREAAGRFMTIRSAWSSMRMGGWNRARPTDGYLDLMFFGYGQDYEACLRDFSRVAGPAPTDSALGVG